MTISRNIFLGLISLGMNVALAGPVPADMVQPDRVDVHLQLKRGDFTVYRYVPGDPIFAAHPLAVIIFGSGDGGFDGWEDRVSHSLQADGYEVLGFDCALYAKTDYDLETLQADTNTIAQSSLAHYGDHLPPLILGGWSMGAEQGVAAAGGPHPPADLFGLLLISPGDRGRYGLRVADRFDVTPTGPGTFGLEDFAHSLNKTRVVQWDANFDLLGSTNWLTTLTAPHKAYDFTFGMHDYNGASDQFLKLLAGSMTWLLSTVGAGNTEEPQRRDIK